MADHLTARYDAAAPAWGRRLAWLGFPAAYRRIVAQVMDAFPLAEGRIDVLDMGAGDGAFAEAVLHVLGRQAALTLVDPSAAMLTAAETRLGKGRVRLIAGNLDSASLVVSAYDLVAAAHLLEHLPDPEASIVRMTALLKPGGVLVLVVSRPHWCSRLVWLSWRHRRFPELEMRRLLAGVGLVDVRCWKPLAGPPRRLSLAYAARRPS